MKTLLITLFLFTTSLFCEEVFVREIDSLLYRYDTEPHFVQIKLTDGSIWKWYPDKYSEHFLCSWSKGDEVIVQTNNQCGYHLENVQQPYFHPKVALNFNSYFLFPIIDQIDLETLSLILSDGSSWKIVYEFNKRTLQNWKEGNRIIAVKGLKDYFEIINLDIPPDQRNRIERNIQVIQNP